MVMAMVVVMATMMRTHIVMYDYAGVVCASGGLSVVMVVMTVVMDAVISDHGHFLFASAVLSSPSLPEYGAVSLRTACRSVAAGAGP